MRGPAQRRRLDEPIAVSLEDVIPANHVYRHLEAAKPASSIRTISTLGEPAGGRSGSIGGNVVSGSLAS